MELLNFGEWINNRDFILCNKPDVLFAESDGDDFEFETRPECFTEYGQDEEVYQYFITNLEHSDVVYYNKHYGLRFIYSPSLDLWVFLNDVCFGMSFYDVNLKYREGEAE